MNIHRSISDYLDKRVDARFKRDGDGNLVFFPMGFGLGRIVPNASTEARLRQVSRWWLVGVFALLIPLFSLVNTFWRPKGLDYLVFIGLASGVGFAYNLLLVAAAHNLPRSTERLSYSGAEMHSLGSCSMKFLFLGFVITALGAVCSIAIPRVRAETDATSMYVALVFCTIFAVIFAIAIAKRRRSGGVIGR